MRDQQRLISSVFPWAIDKMPLANCCKRHKKCLGEVPYRPALSGLNLKQIANGRPSHSALEGEKKRSASTHPQSETLIVLTSILLSNRLSSRRTFDVGINFISFPYLKRFRLKMSCNRAYLCKTTFECAHKGVAIEILIR